MLKLSDELKEFFSKLRVAYFGTGDFAVMTLRALNAVGADVAAVVTSPDAKTGRDQIATPPPVKSEFLNLQAKGFVKNTRLLQPEKLNDEFILELRKLQPAVAVLADYGKILPKKLLEIPKYGFINVHPSLLPKYRGASPIEAAIINGERTTGVTLIVIDEKLDHGPVVMRKRISIREKEDATSLRKRLAKLGAQLVLKSLPRYVNGKMHPIEQKHSEATFTKILGREDGKIAFIEDAETISRKVRALSPWPGTYAIWKTGDAEKRLKILDANAVDYQGTGLENDVEFGKVISIGTEMGIITSKGLLVVHKLQLEGKKPVEAKEFLNGYRDIIGNTLQ